MKKYGLIAFIVLSMLPVRLFAYAIDVFGNGSENKYRFYLTEGNLYQAYVNIPDFQGLQGYSFWIGKTAYICPGPYSQGNKARFLQGFPLCLLR